MSLRERDHIYFVWFGATRQADNSLVGEGRTEVNTTGPIRSLDDIRKVEVFLESPEAASSVGACIKMVEAARGPVNVVVRNFQLLRRERRGRSDVR